MISPRSAAFLLLVLLSLTLAACGGSDSKADARKPVDGDEVKVHYKGSLDDGQVFDESTGKEPLGFVVGQRQVIDGFDKAVRTLSVGQKTKVRLEPAEAYGERRADLVIDVPRSRAPEGIKAGDRVTLGNGAPGVVLEVNADNIKIDANHQLAGKALTFEIELVSIGKT